MANIAVAADIGSSSGCSCGLPSEKELSIDIQRECAAVHAQATDFESVFHDVTFDYPGFRVLKRIGVSSSRSQGHYGANSAVFKADLDGKPCALKGIICAYGPFKKTQGALLNEAVRDELRQPPHSPHLLRYWRQFDAVVRGDVLRDWPFDVQTTPRDSLTKWFVMPLLSEGNLQTWVRTHPLTSETTLLCLILQVLKGVAVLVQHNLLHRDLKLDNILVRTTSKHATPTLMIADFGCMISMDDIDGPVIGNPQHTAPELRAPLAHTDLTKAEVWASGVLCFDIVDSDPPYEIGDNRCLHVAYISKSVASVIERMLEWEPSSRPSPLQAAAEMQELMATMVTPVSSESLLRQCPASPCLSALPSDSGHGLTFAAQPSETSTKVGASSGFPLHTPPAFAGASALRRAPAVPSLPTLAVMECSANSQPANCNAGMQPFVDRSAPSSPDVSASRLRSSLSERRLQFMAQGQSKAAVIDSDSGLPSSQAVSSAQNLVLDITQPSSHNSARSDLALDVRPSPDASLPRLGSSLSAQRLRYGSRAHQHTAVADKSPLAHTAQEGVPPPSPSVNRLGASLSASRLRFSSQSPGHGELSLPQALPSNPESFANGHGTPFWSHLAGVGSPVLQVSKVAASSAFLDTHGNLSSVLKSPANSPSRLRSSLSVRRLRFSSEVFGADSLIRSSQTILPRQQVEQQQACMLGSAAFVAEVPPLPFFTASRAEVT